MLSIDGYSNPIYYALLSDETGAVVSEQLGSTILTKVKLKSDKFNAFKGDLFKLLNKYDDGSVDLVSVDNQTHYLHKCSFEKVKKLSDQEFEILYPVQSHNDRHEVLPFLGEACKLKNNDVVFVFEKKSGKLKNGTLTHVGPMVDRKEKGTYFGVKFTEPFADESSSAEIIFVDRYQSFVTVNHLDLNNHFPSKANHGILYEKKSSSQKERQSLKTSSNESYQNRKPGYSTLFPNSHTSAPKSMEVPKKDYHRSSKTYATMDKNDNIKNVTKKEIKAPEGLIETQEKLLQNISEQKATLSSEPFKNISVRNEESFQRKMESCDQTIDAIKREYKVESKISKSTMSSATYASKLSEPKIPTQNLDEMPQQNPITSTSKSSVFVDTHLLTQVIKCTPEQLNLQLESMVEISIKSEKQYGVLKWKGEDENYPGITFAGIELDNNVSGCSDGTFLKKKRYNSPLNRAFFVKLNQVHPDSRFVVQDAGEVKPKELTLIADKSRPVKGSILPSSKLLPNFTGKNRGIQGHYNSCYMDSSLFAMFAYSHSFDIMLNRKRRESDIKEYDDVQSILKERIVNPLRKHGFVGHPSVLQLRKFLNDLCDIGGFMTEEKDPEEFIVLLFEKVLKVDPFVKLCVGDREEVSHLYQIFCAKDENNVLPSVQYLLEYSFLSSNLKLVEVPSVMILQMPRFGQEKLFQRIQITSSINVAPILSNELQYCALCGAPTQHHCPECACLFGYNQVHTYLCSSCWDVLHKHPSRKLHKKPMFVNNRISKTSDSTQLELFAVVCIEKSHYVSFVKSGDGDDEKWLFFDSMADRVGGENGHNIPEITVVNNLKMYLNGTAEKINELDKKIHEQVIRVFDDASLCFYYNRDLSMYR